MQEYQVKVYTKEETNCPRIEWYQNGKLHRLDGPAIEYADGSKSWYQNGKYHRLDGPAKEYADGSKYWFIDGIKYTQEEFNNKINKTTCLEKTVIIDGVEYKLVKK